MNERVRPPHAKKGASIDPGNRSDVAPRGDGDFVANASCSLKPIGRLRSVARTNTPACRRAAPAETRPAAVANAIHRIQPYGPRAPTGAADRGDAPPQPGTPSRARISPKTQRSQKQGKQLNGKHKIFSRRSRPDSRAAVRTETSRHSSRRGQYISCGRRGLRQSCGCNRPGEAHQQWEKITPGLSEDPRSDPHLLDNRPFRQKRRRLGRRPGTIYSGRWRPAYFRQPCARLIRPRLTDRDLSVCLISRVMHPGGRSQFE